MIILRRVEFDYGAGKRQSILPRESEQKVERFIEGGLKKRFSMNVELVVDKNGLETVLEVHQSAKPFTFRMLDAGEARDFVPPPKEIPDGRSLSTLSPFISTNSSSFMPGQQEVLRARRERDFFAEKCTRLEEDLRRERRRFEELTRLAYGSTAEPDPSPSIRLQGLPSSQMDPGVYIEIDFTRGTPTVPQESDAEYARRIQGNFASPQASQVFQDALSAELSRLVLGPSFTGPPKDFSVKVEQVKEEPKASFRRIEFDEEEK